MRVRRRALSPAAMTVFSLVGAALVVASNSAVTPLYRLYQQSMHLTPLMITLVYAVYRRWCARFSAQGGYSVQQLTPMSDKSDAKILQIFRRQTRQDRVVDLIFAEGRLIFF